MHGSHERKIFRSNTAIVDEGVDDGSRYGILFIFVVALELENLYMVKIFVGNKYQSVIIVKYKIMYQFTIT